MKRYTYFVFALLSLSIYPVALAGSRAADPGPWGSLKISEIFIHQSPGIVEVLPIPSSKTIWRFQTIKRIDDLANFFNRVLSGRLDDELSNLRKKLALQEIPKVETRAFPTAEFIHSLTATERQTIYSELAKTKGNIYHRKPFFIDSDSPRTWFTGSSLTSEAIAIIEKLSYPVGDSLAFSDTPLMLDTVDSKAEEIQMLRALTRTRLLYLELEMSPRTDTKKLKEYWIPHSKCLSPLPLFESLTRKELQPSTFDLIEILPDLPRNRIGDFPSFVDGASGAFPGGAWSSLNFFSENPDEEDLEFDDIEKLINEEYRPVDCPYRYGDLIVYSDPETNRILHLCIYIADDIAFTKNDRSILVPWTMMELKYIKARFSINRTPKSSGWRLR